MYCNIKKRMKVFFDKKTNEYNIPIAVKVKSKKKKGDGRSPSKIKTENIARERIDRDINYKSFFNDIINPTVPTALQATVEEELKNSIGNPDPVDNTINPVDNTISKKSVEIETKETKLIKGFKERSIKIYLKSLNKTLVSLKGDNAPISEKIPNRLYDKSLMVQLSYNIQHAQNLDHFKEAYEEFSSQLQNKDLEFIPRYSNRQSAVVWDPVNDKWYIAYHGARGIQGSDKEGVKDVIMGNFHKNPEYLEAEKQLKRLLVHLDEDIGVNVSEDVELIGYSLGASKSLMLGEKFNLKGTHINSFVNPLIKHEIADVEQSLRKVQTMSRVISDPTTIQSVLPPRHAHNRKYEHILPLAENKTHLDSHGLDQFIQKKPRGLDHIVDGKQNIKADAIGHVATVGGAMLGAYLGYDEGKNNSGEISEEIYRATLGGAESTLPIVGEMDVLQSGIIGFTSDEIRHSFNWFTNLFHKNKEEGKSEIPDGYVEVYRDYDRDIIQDEK